MYLSKIKKGMKLLDQAFGRGWERRIKIPGLDLRRACSCVLGQLYGNYYDGLYALFIYERTAAGFGFTLPETRKNWSTLTAEWVQGKKWSTLTAEWVQAIEDRQGKVKP